MPAILDGKVIVITGGSSGIGLASVEACVAHGAPVVIGDIQDERGVRAADRLGVSALYVHTDVAHDEQVEALVDVAVSHFGRLDVMFNNASAAGDTSLLADLGPEGLDAALRVIVGSAVSGHRYASRVFVAQGGGGSIITTSSTAGLTGGMGPGAYTIGKHALIGLVRQAAAELGPHGIRSNAICPGITMTPAMGIGVRREKKADFFAKLAESLADEQPLKRVATPEDIAGVVVFLASDLSTFVNGAVLPVDGGADAVSLGHFSELSASVRREFSDPR